MDLGTGTGIIGLLLCKKTELKEIVGGKYKKRLLKWQIEVLKLNKLEDKFKNIKYRYK